MLVMVYLCIYEYSFITQASNDEAPNGSLFLYVSSAVLYPDQQGVLSVSTEGDQSSVVSRYRFLSNVISIPKVLKGRSIR